MSEYIYGTDEHGGHWLTGEEIVRCRDCKFYSQEQPTEISGIFKVKHPAWCHKHIAETKPYGFCAWAERKEGGDD